MSADHGLIAEKLRVLCAGFQRFFGEGYYSWSRANLEKLLQPEARLEDERVLERLRHWQQEGSIRIVGDDAVFIEVLEPPRCDEPTQGIDRARDPSIVDQGEKR